MFFDSVTKTLDVKIVTYKIKASSWRKAPLCFHVTSLLCIKCTNIPQIAFGHCRVW